MSSYQHGRECRDLPTLSEAIIRAGARAQSFERGQAYWRSGAVYNAAIQGKVLTGDCEGQSAPSYHLRAELDQAGVLLAQCSCPYDYGGWCKHIVALLLKYVYEPEQFSVRQDPAELLASLDREDLVTLVATLLRERPELYDRVAMAVSAPTAPGEGHRARRQPVDADVYRRQVRSLFRGLGRYDHYGYASAVVAQLREVEAGEQLGGVLALQAAHHGWDAMPEEDDEQQAESMTWPPSLVDIRLNVLERQGRTEEYLAACQQTGRHLRYTLKLCDLDQVAEAAAYAVARLAYARDALTVAKRLRELGHAVEAISTAGRGLQLSGSRAPLAEWLAPIQEAQGRPEQALQLWLVALEEWPSPGTYMNVKCLAGADWAHLQPRATALVEKARDSLTLAQVLLCDEAWDEAIRIAEEHSAWHSLIEMVAEGVAEHRPEWVAQISLRNAERLLVKAHSKSYPQEPYSPPQIAKPKVP